MMRYVLIAALFLSLSSRAFSCSCVSSGGCPGLGGKAFPVFLGTVLSVTDLPRTADDEFLSSRKARIQVDESFGGLSPDTHEVDVLTGSGGGDCGVPFRSGEKYLVGASVGSDASFTPAYVASRGGLTLPVRPFSYSGNGAVVS